MSDVFVVLVMVAFGCAAGLTGAAVTYFLLAREYIRTLRASAESSGQMTIALQQLNDLLQAARSAGEDGR